MRVEVNFGDNTARCDFVSLPAVGHFVDMPAGRCLVDAVVHNSKGGRPSLLCTLVTPAPQPEPKPEPVVLEEAAGSTTVDIVEDEPSEAAAETEPTETPHPLRSSHRRRNR